VATLSTLGYGDVVPETNAERLYSVSSLYLILVWATRMI
jgi:hypothetical protein